jgi:hypothetical protein
MSLRSAQFLTADQEARCKRVVFETELLTSPAGRKFMRVMYRSDRGVACLGVWEGSGGNWVSTDVIDALAVHHDALWTHVTTTGGGVQSDIFVEGSTPP